MNIKNVPAYELIKEEDLHGVHAKGYLLRHIKSGARVLLMENDDDNKVFNIGFRTPPANSTGVPHILEHSVLCGSKNFPAKDPFVELVKGSLNTFLNAMTYPDKTVYPVASCNDKDFQNLMHVYMDAVFYPNIYEHEEIFRQEGWSYKLDSKDDKLILSGVVYNEMKGAFSSPEGVLDRVVLNTIYPDTSYANESGGDPEVIPELSYQEFLDFHSKYYHPSNSYIYLYGNMDMEEKLQWMDREYLSHFDKITVDSEIKLQAPFDAMKEVAIPYSISSEEDEENQTYLSYNKSVGTSLDRELYLAFQVLDYALLSAPGAPLKKALTDAGIGDDILGSYDNGIYQPIFSVIAKNANTDQKDEFVEIIEKVLSNIVKKGVDKKAIQAGINYLEFRYREADFGNYPKGLMYGLQIMDSWLYDEEKPFIHLEALETFEFLKNMVGTSYYEELIKKYILDNTHGAIVLVEPEKGRTARMDAELDEKLQAYKASLSEKQVEELVERTKALEAYQSAPEDPKALEKIPVLEREDISKEIAPIQNREISVSGVPVLLHEVETNGIGYVTLLFDFSKVGEDLLPYVGILQAVLGIIDTEHYDYGELFNEINLKTGGIGTSLELYNDISDVKNKNFKTTFEVKAKALYSQLPTAFQMMGEILTASKLQDEKRLLEILMMLKSRLLMKFTSAGHSTAALRAMSYSSPSARLKDMTGGIEFYQLIKDLTDNFEEKKADLILKLQTLTKIIFRVDNFMISYTAPTEASEKLGEYVEILKQVLYKEKPEEKPLKLICQKKNEGFKTASKVQYVARVGNFLDYGADYHGALNILKVILSYDYLWQNVRVKGGAYGCMSNFSRTGEAYFVSYRDPNLKQTMEIYEGVVDYLKNFEVNDRDMTKYIIGTISNIDQPMTPSTKGDRSLSLYMSHVTEDMIKTERSQILNATKEDIRALAKVAEAMLKPGQICVIGGEDKIEENADMFMNVTKF